jgi:hypothetical protein
MGGGGDSGYEQRQVETENKKQSARDALNLLFGVAPSGGTAPTRGQFTTTPPQYGQQSNGRQPQLIDGEFNGEMSGYSPATPVFNQGAFDQAQAAYTGRNDEAAKNKSARDALYDQVRGDAFTAGQRGITEGKDQAALDNKFAIFAQGLNGGSVDVDQNALLNRTYNQGLIDLGAKADAARADLEGSDEQTRLGLLQSIDAGMDQGSALSSAMNQLKVNSDRATADATGTDLGDLFGNAGLLYTKSNYARGRLGAQDYLSRQGKYFGPGSTGSNGILSPTGG